MMKNEELIAELDVWRNQEPAVDKYKPTPHYMYKQRVAEWENEVCPQEMYKLIKAQQAEIGALKRGFNDAANCLLRNSFNCMDALHTLQLPQVRNLLDKRQLTKLNKVD